MQFCSQELHGKASDRMVGVLVEDAGEDAPLPLQLGGMG